MTVVLGLLGLLVVLARVAIHRKPPAPAPPAIARYAWPLAYAVVVLALGPAIIAVPRLAGPKSALTGDAATHAAVAIDIAHNGLPHGWIDTFNGGFPVALHYQPLSWFVAAILVKLGVPPGTAIRGLGVAAVLVAPLLLVWVARRAGVRPASATIGAVLFAWVVPYIEFTGGFEPFLLRGVLAQVVAIPVLLGWAGVLLAEETVIFERRFDPAPLLGGLAAATHPQVFLAMVFVLTVGTLASWPARARVWRVGRSIAGGLLVAAVLYGPGVLSMKVPFGWPPTPTWHIVGFGPDRVVEWLLEGDLLDYRKAPIVTWVFLVALVVHAGRWRIAASRGLLAASIAALASLASTWLTHTGWFGDLVLAAFQPMRVITLVPAIAALSIMTALDVLVLDWLPRLAGAATRLPERVRVRLPLGAPILLGVTFALDFPARVAFLDDMARQAVTIDPLCVALGGFDPGPIRRWLSEPVDGRTFYDTSQLSFCSGVYGAELDRRGPMALSQGAGVQVGVLVVAFSRLAASEEGGALRAETLGVRRIVHRATKPPLPAEAWERVHEEGALVVSRRLGGSAFVGVGCVRSELRGREKDLRAELLRMLAGGGRAILDHPQDLEALEVSDGPLERRPVEAGECDPTAARVEEEPREPGAYAARVVSPHPVDVVFRATAYGGWKVREHGVELPIRRVSPGFFAVRVGPGTSVLEALVELPPAYPLRVVAGSLALVALGLTRRRSSAS